MAVRRKAAGAATSLVEFERELGRGWPAGLTVLTGDDLYSLDRAQRALLARLGDGDPSGFARTVFGQDKVELSTVVGAARSVGMFASRRVVFVNEVAALSGEPEPLEDYAAAPPRDSYLIVRAPALDRRKKLHQVLGKSGRLLDFPSGDLVDARRRIGAIADELGLELESSAAAVLAEIAAGDLYRAANELEKIRCWAGRSGTRVTPEVIREIASGRGVMSGWEVADAVLRRDRAAGLAAVRGLTAAGDEALRIVGGVAWRARVLLRARALVAAGGGPGEALRQVRGAFFFKEALLEGIRRYSLDEVLAFPAKLLAADRMLKSRSLAASAILEDLVDRLTGPRES